MSVVLEHLYAEAPRYVVIADFVVMLACGYALATSYKPTVPQVLHSLAMWFGAVFALVGAAIVVNVVLPVPLSPGVIALAIFVTPTTAVIARKTTRALLAARAELIYEQQSARQ